MWGYKKLIFLLYKLTGCFSPVSFLEVYDISDHSSETNIYGIPKSGKKMASEVGQLLQSLLYRGPDTVKYCQKICRGKPAMDVLLSKMTCKLPSVYVAGT